MADLAAVQPSWLLCSPIVLLSTTADQNIYTSDPSDGGDESVYIYTGGGGSDDDDEDDDDDDDDDVYCHIATKLWISQ